MKRIMALLLSLVMVLSLAACGGGNTTTNTPAETETVESTPEPTPAETKTPESTPDPVWVIQQTVDEFGDITEDSAKVLCAQIDGDFSNTATASSDLNGTVFFQKIDGVPHYVMGLVLNKYNDTPVTYLSGDSLILKTKIGNEITEYSLSGDAPNGTLSLGSNLFDYFDYNGDIIFNTLYSGEDVRCIVMIGSSQYNFTLFSANFQKLCEEENFAPGTAKVSTKEAVSIFLKDDGENIELARDALIQNADELELMNSDMIIESMTGNMLEILIDVYTPLDDKLFPWWYGYEYTNGSAQCVVDCCYALIGDGGYRKYGETSHAPILDTRVEGDLFIVGSANGNSETIYQCRKITDNIILLCMQKEDGSFSPSKLVLHASDSSKNGLQTAVAIAILNDLPLIEQ